MADDNDVEDALDMSLKAGENEERQVVEVRSRRNGKNREKIPLARIERRSLDGGEPSQRGEGHLLYSSLFILGLFQFYIRQACSVLISDSVVGKVNQNNYKYVL